MNLDAADGVIDGKFFGRQIVQSRPAFPATAGYSVPSTPFFGGNYQYSAPAASFAPAVYSGPQIYTQAYNPVSVIPQQNSALALDAADGVIDGKFFGSRIASVAPRPVATAFPTAWPASFAPAQGFAPQGFAPQSFAPQSFAQQSWGAPVSYSVAPTSYGFATQAPRVIQSHAMLPSTAPFGNSNAAFALDAADGVIDGKYHGRQIVHAQQPTGGYFPAQSRSAAAQALDAADGVIDGRYHGRPIVERR